MEQYVIGIVDEDIEDIEDIERTIIINKPEAIVEEQIVFQKYDIPADTESIISTISDEITQDIISNKIQSIIIDYKIISNTECIEGTDIFRKINEIAPKFPVIILTNLPQDCYAKEFVDADKIYSKGQFFKVSEAYSKEKTLNIFKNMGNYSSLRAKLSTKLNSCLSTLETQGYSQETLCEIIETEKLLDNYYPQQQSTIEKELNVTDLKSAVDLIKEVNGILGDHNED